MASPEFDPTLPADHAPIVAAELRNQFNGLPESEAMRNVLYFETAGNASGVELLNLPISSPPTQAQVEAIRDKLNELIDTLNRV